MLSQNKYEELAADIGGQIHIKKIKSAVINLKVLLKSNHLEISERIQHEREYYVKLTILVSLDALGEAPFI